MQDERASTTALLLPWLLAAAGLVFGATMWLRSLSPPSAGTLGPASESKEAATLKAALASANAANDFLRRELDRLRASTNSPAATASGPVGGAGASGTTVSPTSEQRDMGNRLKDALGRVAAGDIGAKAEAAKAVWALLQSGPGAAGVLRDAYLTSGDSLGKSLVLGSMVFQNTPEAKDLVIDQVQSEKDPQLRSVLMNQAARYATGDTARALAPTFIQSIDSADDPQTRIAAIRGLRYAPGGDGSQALMHAAADPSEEVRVAAIDVLLARQPQDPLLAQLIANDSSPRVREFAHCQQVVTSELAPAPRKRRR